MNNWIAFGIAALGAVVAACAYWAARCVKAFAAIGVAVAATEVGLLAGFIAAVIGVMLLGSVAWIRSGLSQPRGVH